MNRLRVSIHTALSRLRIPSGVPRHIREMVSGLLRDDSVAVEFFVNRAEAERWLSDENAAWQKAPVTSFNIPTSLMVRSWGLLNWPSFELLGGEADWLYLPADGYVSTKSAKLAVTVHDVYKLEPPAPFENKLEHHYARLRHQVIYARAAQHARKIFTVSQFSADRIMHHLKIAANRIDIVGNGVSDSFFRPRAETWELLRQKFGLEEGKFFVHCGGFKAKKNAIGIIAAWGEIERRNTEFKLVAAGHHDPKFLQSAQRSLKRAVFPERLNDEELAALLHHSAALMLPSFYEGFGLPVIEAMAAGTVLVLSDIPALREVAQNIAFYANPFEPGEIAHAIESCIVADNERADRIAEGRRRAELFTWSECVKRLRSALQ
jgi:glycosyltransferase involved in cell wall biosynthesis